MITKKVTGTSRSACVYPASIRRAARIDEIAAATIPRRAIQARKMRSWELSVEPAADTNTAAGLATNISTSKNNTPARPTSAKSLSRKRAARMMKMLEISTVRGKLRQRTVSLYRSMYYGLFSPGTI